MTDDVEARECSVQESLALAKKRMPDDFDWVSARGSVWAGSVFETLADRIEKDVRRYEAWSGSKCEFQREGRSIYVSTRQGFYSDSWRRVGLGLVYNRSDGVRADPHILVRPSDNSEDDYEAKPTLQHDGEIMIEVKGHPPLSLWQFARLTLEPVFFPTASQ